MQIGLQSGCNASWEGFGYNTIDQKRFLKLLQSNASESVIMEIGQTWLLCNWSEVVTNSWV